MQSHLPYDTFCPFKKDTLEHESAAVEYVETPKIVERWMCGLLFLIKVMLPSLALCSDPSSKAIRVCSVSSICNFLRTSASLDGSLFDFLFVRDIVADHRARGKVSACHLLLEAAAVCIDLEPEVCLSVYNKSVNVEDEEELDEEETLWFPYKLLFRNFRAHTEFESDIFKTARLSFSFRLMKSLCSLSLLSAASFIESPLQQSPQPSSMYDFDQMKKWLNILNSLPIEKCPVKESLEDDNDEDNEYFSNPFFVTCYMMICKESTQLYRMVEFQNDQAAQDCFSNHFIKVTPLSDTLHIQPNQKLIEHLKAPYFEDGPARVFATQLFKVSAYDLDDEGFKHEFSNPTFSHDRMVVNWIDFLSAYVELNSKKLSCPSYDVSEVEDRDELEELVSSLKDVLSVEADQDACHTRIFRHMNNLFGNQSRDNSGLHSRWMKMIERNRPPIDACEITRCRQVPHPLDLQDSDEPKYGGVTCLGILVSFWLFPYTTTSVKVSLVRYLRCYLDGVHHFHQQMVKQVLPSVSVKELETVKDLSLKKCRLLFCIPSGQREPLQGDSPAISAIKSDFIKKEWSHTIELLKLLRVMLVFELEPSKYMHPIIECLRSCFQSFSFFDDEGHSAMFQRYEVFNCFASILSDLCESFDPADYFLSHQHSSGSGFGKFRYAILRQVCVSESNREPLCCLFLRFLSYISRHTHYVQLMPAALSATRLLLTAHERQKELGVLRASDKFIFRPFEEVSLDSFEATMISNFAVPYLFCASGQMEIRTFPALSLFMSCLHPDLQGNEDAADAQTSRKNPYNHRRLLEFPSQLCSWASSSTLLSLSNSVLLLSSSMLLLSRILEDAARTIPNSSHGILLQVIPSAEMPSSHRCGPALDRVDKTLSFVLDALLEQDGYGFFNFHSYLKIRRDEEDHDHFHSLDPRHPSTPLIHQWIFFPSGNALSSSSRRLSKFLSCQSLAHRNILTGDFFCQFSFGRNQNCPNNDVFGTFHPFQLQLFDRQECHDAIFQKLMDVGSERSHECVKDIFSSRANTLVNFIALLKALACVSVNSICDILRTCPPKSDSTHHAPSLAHILLNLHPMFSHSIVDDSAFVFFDDYHVSRLLLSLLCQVKGFSTVPNETQRFENLNHRMVWLLPILSRSWEIIAMLLDDPFSRLLCTHVIQIFRGPGETWLWGTRGQLGQFEVDADARHTSLPALIDCASFLSYYLKMDSNLNPSYPWEDVFDSNGCELPSTYLNTLHDLLSHGTHAIAWSVRALKSIIWITTELCPDRFSYDCGGLADIWRWAEGTQIWNRKFIDTFPSNESQDPEDDDEYSMSGLRQPDERHLLETSIRHAVESRSNFSVEQQLFELLLRCQNNPFDNGIVDEGHNLPGWFIIRLKEWYHFEDKILLGDVLAACFNSSLDLQKEWDIVQSKAGRLNVSLLSPPGPSYQWMKSFHDVFRIIDRSKLEVVFRHNHPLNAPVSPDEAFKSISMHALQFNHALSLKSAKCHLAQSLGSFFSVIFQVPSSSQFDMGTIYHREEVSTCMIFIDFALQMCLCLRDWLVTHLQSDFTLRFFKAARFAIFRLKGLSDADKESFLLQHHSLCLKISENICQIIISESSNVNQAAVFERQQLYMLLLEYLSAFHRNNSGNQGSDFVLQHVLCCDEQRYLPVAFFTILRDVAESDAFQSIEAIMLLARLLARVPATIAIVNVVASSISFGSSLARYVDGPMSQSPLFSSVFYARCSLLCRIAQQNPSLIAPIIVTMRQSPFFAERGSFFSVVSSQQSAQQNMAQFADQVIAFHLVADSFMCVIFRCAFALDTLKSFSATEGLLELLHFLHFGFYQNRAGDNLLVENWLLRLLRHFSGSRDPYLEYLTRKRACLPATHMRPFSSFATTLCGQVSAAVLSLAVLQRHRVRNWIGAASYLAIFDVADKQIPQILISTALFDVSVANVDVLELPRDKFSQEDVEYDRMMAIYQ